MKKIILTLCIVLAGCSNLNTRMDALIGTHIDDVIENWGAPHSYIDRSDGGKTYTWKPSKCTQNLITNSKGIIVKQTNFGCNPF